MKGDYYTAKVEVALVSPRGLFNSTSTEIKVVQVTITGESLAEVQRKARRAIGLANPEKGPVLEEEVIERPDLLPGPHELDPRFKVVPHVSTITGVGVKTYTYNKQGQIAGIIENGGERPLTQPEVDELVRHNEMVTERYFNTAARVDDARLEDSNDLPI